MTKKYLFYFWLSVGIVLFNLPTVFAANSSIEPQNEKSILARLDAELQWLQDEAVIFSASRREQKVSETAAAAYVITHEDIRRSGATSIPDALRGVPGLQVAQINSNVWAISARGYNERFPAKLLVLIDGRTVYTTLFAGVFWHSKDILLEDVERIEVIRGPGAALWGANAVNGVINIITKNANKTLGGFISAGAGKEERGFGSIRYGKKINENTAFRVYAKYFNRDDFKISSGESAEDEWDSVIGGFRIDGEISDINTYTLQGNIYNGDAGELQDVAVPFSSSFQRQKVDKEFSGGNILGKWNHTWSDESESTLQLYFDRTEDHFDLLGDVELLFDTYDLDFQHNFHISSSQNITWGLGFRYISDLIGAGKSELLSFKEEERNTQLYSTFMQDEITIVPERLKFILGSKFEHNDFSGFEYQPNGRLLWTPLENHSFWAAISRAVRTPHRTDHDLDYFLVFPLGSASVAATGNKDFDSEKLMAYELGYRFKWKNQFSLDIAAFYNQYDGEYDGIIEDPYTTEIDSSTLLIIPVVPQNVGNDETYGVELHSAWKASPWWRFQASYSLLEINTTDEYKGLSPRHQSSLKSSMDITENWEWDALIRYLDKIDDPLLSSSIKSYFELDMRLGWNPLENLDVSLIGKNLLHDGHKELEDTFFGVIKTEIERSIFGKVTWRF